MLKNAFRILYLGLYLHYPPRVYFFFPLYSFLRRRLSIPMAASNFLVWFVSALLHALAMGLIGKTLPVAIVFSVFLILGCISTAAVIAKSKGKPTTG